MSTKSRRELSSSFFFVQDKAPKEIHAIVTEIWYYNARIKIRISTYVRVYGYFYPNRQ